MKKSLFALLLALLITVFSLPVFAEDSVETPAEPVETEEAVVAEDLFFDPELPVELTVYVYDLCGGCGGGVAPGCGDCEATIEYHGALTRAFGDHLYDGSITYRIPNARMRDKLLEYEEFAAEMGVDEVRYAYFPAVFITQNRKGFYMVGEEAFYDTVEFFEAYINGTSVAELQAEADKRYFERKAEAETEAAEETVAD